MIPIKVGLSVLAAVVLVACSSAPHENPAAGAESGQELPDDREAPIVAKVNGEPVLRGSYQHSLTILRDRLAARENSVEEYLNAKFDVFDGLVANELLYQESKRQGVTVSESELYGELERIGKDKGGVDGFVQWMGSFGLTRDQAIESVRKRLAVDRYIDETIARHIQADEQEMRDYYEDNQDRLSEPLRVRVSQILIRCGKKAPPEQVENRRRRAQEILDNIRGGGIYTALAREFSEDRSAALDGDIGFITKGSAFPELEAAAFDLEAGEVAELVRTEAGFHIIMVTERSGGTVPDYEAVKEACRRMVVNGKRNALVRAAIDRLRETADVESYLN
jgi:peptidyl-prolyl cis-trans isomerase C